MRIKNKPNVSLFRIIVLEHTFIKTFFIDLQITFISHLAPVVGFTIQHNLSKTIADQIIQHECARLDENHQQALQQLQHLA